YTTVKWTGNLESRSINLDTGEVSEAATWCAEDIVAGTCASPGSIASELVAGSTVYYCVTPNSDADSCSGTLDGTSCKVEVPTSCNGTMAAKVDATTDTRTIKMNVGGSLADFNYTNITAAGLNANFDSAFLT